MVILVASYYPNTLPGIPPRVREYPEPPHRPMIESPLRSSGVRPNFDRPWGGDRETQFQRTQAALSGATTMIGNILLWRGRPKDEQAAAAAQTAPQLGPPQLQTQSRSSRRTTLALNPGPARTARAVGPAGPRIMGELMPGPPVHVMNSQGTGSAIPARSAEVYQPELGENWGRSGAIPLPPVQRTRRPRGADPRTRNANQPTLF